jgi:hypothetical protein
MKALLGIILLTALASASACAPKTAPMTRKLAVELIENSQAFKGPMDPGITFTDATFHPGPNTKRELLRLTGLMLKEDGPLGLAGSTATAAFTWKWTEGPFAGQVMVSKAKLNNATGTWKVYEEPLKHSLWQAERGESQE